MQEQIHPKAIIEDLRAGNQRNGEGGGASLFEHFGVTDDDREAQVEFYKHSQKWSNRMILGDGLQVMASLAEREGLKGQVQAIYIDPPYGINFSSNFQWSTTSTIVKNGNLDHLTREPEQVRAFRDTWRDGIHSYLRYIRDRLVVSRELLTETGSCFVQIGDENVHRVRALMDEVFGEENFIANIAFKKKKMPLGEKYIFTMCDYVIWYGKNSTKTKFRKLFKPRKFDRNSDFSVIDDFNEFTSIKKMEESKVSANFNRAFQSMDMRSSGRTENCVFETPLKGELFFPAKNKSWKTNKEGMRRLLLADRLYAPESSLRYKYKIADYPSSELSHMWMDLQGATNKNYVVETATKAIERCLLMVTDPGDLVLDPTCGSGTTAFVAEQWGRRWITIDTSRVALALARARILGAKYPWYLLADSDAGQKKEAQITRSAPSTSPTYGDIRHGFILERIPHITLGKIGANTEIDTIWEQLQPAVDEALAKLNSALSSYTIPFTVKTGGRKGLAIDFTASGDVKMQSGEMAPVNGFMEWEVPLKAPEGWSAAAADALVKFWGARIARQTEIDASIAANAEFQYLYDKPYEDKKRIRVSGPFTVESLSPHRTQAVNEYGELIDGLEAASGKVSAGAQEAENYRASILENLDKSGVQQEQKADRINFTTLTAWPGEWLSAEGRYFEGDIERRAGIFIGPEYGTLQRADLMAAAREAVDAKFDILITCAFNYDAHSAETRKLGRLPILQARMNPDLHMAGDLKAGGGNLFVVFGEPDIELQQDGEMLKVEIKGVDIFKPATGAVVSSEPDDIACWFIDTDYNEESFFVRHAYFPGAEIPYKQLKTTLKGEIDQEAWDSLKRTVSRSFNKPKSGRIAVKVINHLGDEVMKVLDVSQ